jgi:hypothetical protein
MMKEQMPQATSRETINSLLSSATDRVSKNLTSDDYLIAEQMR